MKKIDISILKEEPLRDVKAKLLIEPLAPLSMVSELPGSYYKSLMCPTKKMICGLFENILGWHFDLGTRIMIIKDLQNTRKKQKLTVDYKSFIQGSTYIPLLYEYFELNKIPQIERLISICTYDDYWSRLYRRADSHQHINGIRFMDANTIHQLTKVFNDIDADDTIATNVKNQQKTKWFQSNIGKFAQYYSSPTKREFLDVNGVFCYDIEISSKLLKILHKACEEVNIGYLGNSEGWVFVKLIQL